MAANSSRASATPKAPTALTIPIPQPRWAAGNSSVMITNAVAEQVTMNTREIIWSATN